MRSQPHRWPEITVKSQPVLPLRAMSGSVATQWQGLVSVSLVHIATMVPSGTTWVSRGCAELSPPLTGCSTLEKWPLHLACSSTWKSTVELVLVAGARVS